MLFSKQKNSQGNRRSSRNVQANFRRNAPVISSSQRAIKDHQQSVTQRQLDAVHRRQRILYKRRIYAFIICAATLFIGFRLQVSAVDLAPMAQTTPLTSAQEYGYRGTISRYISEHVTLRQSWLIDVDALTKAVQNTNPEVSSLVIHTKNPFSTKAIVDLQFRKPILLYKGLGSTQFVDSHGVLFDKNQYKNVPVTSLPIIEDQGGVAPYKGQTVLSQQVIGDIAQIYISVPQLYSKKTTVTSVVLPRSSREVQAKISSQPYTVKFSTDRSITDQVGELHQLLAYLTSNHITPSSYIDVRVANKAFYK